jgi:hypothetical protein
MTSNSRISVVFPTSIKLDSTCTIDSATSPMVASTPTCTISGQTIIVDNPFGTSGSYSAGSPAFSFIFSTGGTNPSSATDAGSFTASTFRLLGTPAQAWLQDQKVFTNRFSADPSTLQAAVSNVSPNYEAYYSPSIYTLSITPFKTIPIGAVLTIEFPPEISIVGFGVSSCVVNLGSSPTTVNTITTV